ncbi:MAG: sigma-54-dependent transcriptional regulator [Pyrinomonadaceae bacterium]
MIFPFMKKILVIDDDRASCELLREILAAQNLSVETAQTPAKALTLAGQTKFDLVVSDINLEAEKSGFDLLQEFRGKCPVILVTGFGSLDAAVEATREGAWDFISKPFKVEEIVKTVGRALEQKSRAADDAETISAKAETAGMVGRAPAMIQLYKEIARVAPAKSTVLILGESGTGKELIARAIHQYSPRARRAFVPVNCGALTESLLESELFGSVRGAYTGAHADRKGLWEEADGGTLFLDEIGEISLAMQVKLLRALQEGEIRRVGSSRTIEVNARIIAATNRNLEEEVKTGRFREDLFYRLSVVTLNVPALRERRSDIPLLAEKFLVKAGENAGREHLQFSENVMKVLTAYDWKGNVRELEAAIEHAALRARGNEIQPEDLPDKLRGIDTKKLLKNSLENLFSDLPSLDEVEKRYLQYILEKVDNNRTRAAEILGIDRRTLYRMAERFGIDLDE